MATACIISGQCRSAADNVKNQVGIPIECNIAKTSWSSCCQYGGEPRIFLRNLYACWSLTSCCTYCGFRRTPAVTLLPPSVLPQDNHRARFVSLCMCFRSTIC